MNHDDIRALQWFKTMLGLELIKDPNMVCPGEPVQVRRSWRERLFSRPWRPLDATKTHVPMVPRKDFYVLMGKTIVAHPERARELLRAASNPCSRGMDRSSA